MNKMVGLGRAIAVLCLLGAAAAVAGPAAGADKSAEKLAKASFGAAGTNATVITSKRLTFDYAERKAVFEENVKVVDPSVTITADQITVTFGADNQPETVMAAGHVRVEQTDRWATCQRAVYSVKSGLLVLTGRPKLVRGQDVLQGSRIIFYRYEEKAKCEDAVLTIFPGESGLDKMMKD